MPPLPRERIFMLTFLCWGWIIFVNAGFFITAVTTPELEHQRLATFLFGMVLIAILFLLL